MPRNKRGKHVLIKSVIHHRRQIPLPVESSVSLPVTAIRLSEIYQQAPGTFYVNIYGFPIHSIRTNKRTWREVLPSPGEGELRNVEHAIYFVGNPFDSFTQD